MHHPSRGQLDYEEDENGSKEQIIGLHKVTGPDLISMIGQKRRPGLVLVRGRQTPPGLAHVFLHTTLADLDP